MKISDQQWTEFVDQRQEANFLQSAEWAKLHRSQGRAVVRQFVPDERDEACGGWQGVVMDARRGRYLEVPGGPLIDWSDKSLSIVRAQLEIAARQHNCLFVRIRPQLADSADNRQLLSSGGFNKAPFHLYAENTSILDISQDEQQLLAGMRRQTRYEIKQAKKQSLEVTYGSDMADLEQFYQLQQQTASRQGFIIQPKSFITGLAGAFGYKVRAYRVTKDGQLLNMAIVIWFGEEADYFEAASTLESRRFAGAYGLLWQAIVDAKATGMKRFNFWGITLDSKANHRFKGVTTFKRGFGGVDVVYTPAHDLVIKPMRYQLTRLFEMARRKRRKL